MTRALRLGLLSLALLAVLLAAGLPATTRAGQAMPTPTPLPAAVFATPEAACRAALDTYIGVAAPGRRFQLGAVQRLDAWAYAYAQEVDATGRPLGESFVALLAQQEAGWGWRALAPHTSTAGDYNALLDRFPEQLLDAGLKARLLQPGLALAAAGIFDGHRLPWPAGILAYMTQKDGQYHDAQIDFDIQGLAAAGEVYASKPGRVVFVKQSSRQGSCNPAAAGWENAVVIEHDTGEYSWYLHLAYGSVPVQVGQTVGYGTLLGREGATGYSCGAHLHYMVSTGHTPWTDPNDPSVLPWATGKVAVDFQEVPWADMVVGQTYISANSAIPVGSITAPAEGARITSGPLLLEAQVTGNDRQQARFVAYYGEAWHSIGANFVTPHLGFYWDMCAAGVPDGPLAIGLEVCDSSDACTRLPVERQVVKRHSCTEAPSLSIVQPLTLSPATATAGRPVSAGFTVRNTGRQSVTLPGLAVIAHGPASATWPAAGPVDLRIYEDYTFQGTCTLATAGKYLVEPALQDAAGAWQAIPGGAVTLTVTAP